MNPEKKVLCRFTHTSNEIHSSSWLIPNIKHELDRLSKKKPKHFTVLDLTSGYLQIPINEQSRTLTTFRTTIGLFEWRRLPMRLKGAGIISKCKCKKRFKDLLYT